MKNKRFYTIIAVVVMSFVLLSVGAMAANRAGSAYEQFKSVIDQDHESIENATVNMSMAVSDNGEAVIALDGSMKLDKAGKKMSGSFQTSGKASKSFELYKNNDDMFLHLTGSENWYKMTQKDEHSENEEKSRCDFERERRENADENKRLVDALLDTIMGDYKEQINMTESNGQRTFSLSLSEGNMPILLQTVFQMSDKHEGIECEDSENLSLLPQELQDAINDMKMCEYDVELINKKLERIEISITVDQKNNPIGMSMSMNCSGTDVQGTYHALNIDFSMEFSDVGTTMIDEANPDTASITVIDNDAFNCSDRRHNVRD